MKDVGKLDVRDGDGGAVVCVKVVPGSSRDKVVGLLGSALKITTSTAAQKGQANAKVAAILAKVLGLGCRAVKIVAGNTNPRKEFHISGLTADQVRKILRDM